MKDEHRGLVFPGGEPEAVGSGGGRAETQLLRAGPLPAHFISFACVTTKQSFLPQQGNSSDSSSLGPMPVVLTRFDSVLLPAHGAHSWQVRVRRE